MNKKKFHEFKHLKFFLLLLFLAGCNESNKNIDKTEAEFYSPSVKLSIDEAVFNMVDKPCLQFDTLDANAELTIKKGSAWDCMARLLSGEANAIILPRNYSHYEDSVMKAFKVKPYTRMVMAYDALVFYVRYNNPLDSLSDSQIKDVMFNKGAELRKFYPKLTYEPEFVTNSYLSSELENLRQLVLGGKTEKRHIRMLTGYDSVLNYVKTHPEAIGIGYLSQVMRQPDLRPLRISYLDSAGKYVFPHNVHQANIVRRLYPYIVPIYIYIYDERKDAAMRLGRYLSKHGNVQKYFLDYGIAPAFAKIKLIDEGD